MVGSRLLFQGYGVSRKMRPYHAGLLGADSLLVLDEAHLVPPFEELLRSIAERGAEFRPKQENLRDLLPPFRLLSLSATGRSLGSRSLTLTDADLRHEVLSRRLNATKHLLWKPLNPAAAEDSVPLPDALAREAWTLIDKGRRSARILVFCNSRTVAEKTKVAVQKLANLESKLRAESVNLDTELFVGGRRVFEREQARKRLADLGFVAGSNRAPERPVFLFATSAAEVGVDLDADHMVCDLVPWERMVQRLGRVNRRGYAEATVVVVLEPEPQPKKKEQEAIRKEIDGEDLDEKEQKLLGAFDARVRDWKSYQAPFEHLPRLAGAIDVSPRALRHLKHHAEGDPELQTLLDHATTRAPLRPALTRALVNAWSMTSLKEHTGRPAIDPWIRGWIENDPPQTAMVWRTYLPVRSGPHEPTNGEVEGFFEGAPPHTSEILETETSRVLQWLEERAKLIRKAADKGQNTTEHPLPPAPDEVVAFVLSRAGDLRDKLRLENLAASDGAESRKERRQNLREALAGGTLVVDARLGGLSEGLLNDKEASPPRTADDGQPWIAEHVTGFRIRRVDPDQAGAPDDGWRERLRFATEVSEEGEPRRWLVIEKWRHDARTEDDRSSSHPQLLDDHHSYAEQRAKELSLRLGLQAEYAEMLTTAARIHDEGKRANRWQRAFNAPTNGPYAKTKGPIDQALLDGYRHELGSLPHAEQEDRLRSLREQLRDLALHLIAAHHGFGRPAIGISGCEDAPPSIIEGRAQEVALRFARLQRRWGPWGLAWWEALLRAADQQASRDNDAAQPPGIQTSAAAQVMSTPAAEGPETQLAIAAPARTRG